MCALGGPAPCWPIGSCVGVSGGHQRRLSPEHAALGAAIRAFRVEGSLSQEALAARSSLHRTYVGGIERGERNVSFSNLLRLARALGVRPSELLIRAEGIESLREAEPREGDR
jgi:transcriptional regulator with XRE-family HTH domain